MAVMQQAKVADIESLMARLKFSRKRTPAEQAAANDAAFEALRVYAVTRDERLRTALLQYFVWIPETVLRRHAPSPDTRQVAYMGLVKALSKVDPTRTTAFVEYAFLTVAGEVKRYFRDNSWRIGIGRPNKEILMEVQAHLREDQSLGLEALAGKIGITTERLNEALVAGKASRLVSFSAPLGNDSAMTVGDTVGNEDPGLDDVERRVTVQSLLSTLDERSQRILYLRFYLGMTQEEIGKEIGVTQMHISRLIQRALKQLREVYEL